MDKIVIPVIVALLTAFSFWVISKIGLIPSLVSTPSGAIIAFDEKNCPEIGWEEYKPAYGMFLRGVDKSGTQIDPDGERSTGIPQTEAIGFHNHSIEAVHHVAHAPANLNGHGYMQGNMGGAVTTTGNVVGNSIETRPKNVAVLYCKKK